ncbi:hypothetical protein OUZ56_007806 [Daphnia magna]|uniref:Uncharacterized protein n=1 Tax=Daphnia magna TaxID=35525 RepID=A0ABR0AB19_9CRUS|nr:hypothetical protein OUZ56_007806 [Daphnia magna]
MENKFQGIKRKECNRKKKEKSKDKGCDMILSYSVVVRKSSTCTPAGEEGVNAAALRRAALEGGREKDKSEKT